MKQDKETRNKLLQSARAEFIEKGYMKASLRSICKNAGVTTGALYFFFEDKEDLFAAVTKDAVDAIYHLMQTHFQEEREMAAKGMIYEPIQGADSKDLDVSQMIIHQMYLHREDVLLVLTKSQGSALEHMEDKFVETVEGHFQSMARQMQMAYPDKVLDEKFVHWLAHEQIGAFVYMITHIEDEKDAMKFMQQIVTYMTAGWYGLFMNRD